MKKLIFGAVLLLNMQLLGAQSIRAVYVNVPGTDNGFEYFEVTGTPGAALTNLYFLAIEGDGSGAGLIDLVKPLGAYSLGSNGLLLWRDGSTVLVPAPSPETTIVIEDFSPDIENGSNTFLIVNASTAPTVGTDIDSDNDGTANSSGLPWTSVLSAVGIIENNGASNYGYADDFGGTNQGPYAGYNPDFLAFTNSVWVDGDVLGTSPGPYTVDPARNNQGATYSATLTPGNTAAPLPIILKYFKASANDQTVGLTWSTATETNNDRFIIERSADGTRFLEIGQVNGAGNSTEAKNYSFTDETPLQGINFYRLKQVDFDGQLAYSAVVSVSIGKSVNIRLTPQPVNDQLRVQFDEALKTDAAWEVLDFSGRLVLSGTLAAETATLDIDMTTLTKGSYVLRIADGAQGIVKQFQKQ